ncbi:MAG TPA: HAD-IA family hydrolase [Moraxellaceae bacterium]
MPKPRLFIFDWDGTLMDSERQIVICMQEAARDLKLVVPRNDEVRVIIGLGLPEAILRLFPDHDRNTRELIRRAYAKHFVAEAGGRSELFPGAQELLDELRSQGHLLAIATGKSRLGLDRVLGQTGLINFFDTTRCADETASKPDPLMLRQILTALTVFPGEAVMIGDTSFDLEMASRAGVRSVGIAHGVHAVDELEKHRPVAIVPDLHALARCLASL